MLHNGVLTLNHFELQGNTPFNELPKYEKHGKLPIHLQDHGNPVRFRNIWVREIKPIEGKQRARAVFPRSCDRQGDGRFGTMSTKIRGKRLTSMASR